MQVVKSNLQLIKLLLPYFKKQYLKIIFALVLLPIVSVSYAVQPLILQKAIDSSLKDFDLQRLYFFVGLLALAVAFNFVAQVFQFWFINQVGQFAVADLRQSLFAHLLSLPMTYFDKTPVGRNVSRITSDVEQLSESFAGGLILVMMDFFNILAILVFMFFLDWRLSFAVSIFLIPIYVLSIHYQTMFRTANLKARKKLSELNSFLQQNVVGINVVHALNSAQKSMQKFAKSNKEYFKANDISIKADSQLSALIELISILSLLLMIYVSSFILKNDFVTIGIVLAFLQYTQSLFEPIRNLSDRFTIIQSAFTSAERVDQLFSETSEQDSGQKKSYDAKEEKVFQAKNIFFKYKRASDLTNDCLQLKDSNWVLGDFSFDFYQGKKYAICGRTGSGKSTIVKLLTRLYEIDQGELLFYDKDIKTYTKEFLRNEIAVIHQDTYIFAGTLKENIALNRPEYDLDWQFVEPLLDLIDLDLDMVLSERASNISSGEAQVINFARALITRPKFVILDEATAKIDLKTEKTLQNFLDRYLHNKTAIIIAHRLQTIRNCDEILFLDGGTIVENGSHQELLERNSFYASYLESFKEF